MYIGVMLWYKQAHLPVSLTEHTKQVSRRSASSIHFRIDTSIDLHVLSAGDGRLSGPSM